MRRAPPLSGRHGNERCDAESPANAKPEDCPIGNSPFKSETPQKPQNVAPVLGLQLIGIVLAEHYWVGGHMRLTSHSDCDAG
jgi:hypothetical protein